MRRPTTKMYQMYGVHVSALNIRRVWMAVSLNPCATTKELAHTLNMQYSGVAAALRLLRDAGYIAFTKYESHARQVIIPFVQVLL